MLSFIFSRGPPQVTLCIILSQKEKLNHRKVKAIEKDGLQVIKIRYD
ncbi:hypothetical protein GCM10011482_07720 [Enterococcus alcedinis]|uniref:Uncharacterized protein n=1 Tax=Enterococcus alcedinis TaxID=1274384 RepID=A0A917N412_9ENTE|nr:hypothetical protein GCM10011482_07720 [Enterococcus alcedinis]